MMADERFMREALQLAARGRGGVEPNPMVGAVLVQGDRMIGRGWHARCGGPHAEVVALDDARQAGAAVAGATLYVTLEPCRHHGRTPPCTEAILTARLGRVVVAMIDPFEQVSGEGVRHLRDAGVEVTVGVCEAEARALNAAFIKRQTTGLPWVTLKWAQTLDGRIATRRGDSQWISGEPARQRVHAWRGTSDAVMVGIGTALADDPQLTARGVDVQRPARRVVVDPELALPTDAKLAQSLDTQPPVTLAVSRALVQADTARVADWEARGVSVVGLPALGEKEEAMRTPAALDLSPLLRELVQTHDATHVLVEGGGALHGALLAQGLADQVRVFVAPMVMGDATARPAVRGLTCNMMADVTRLTLQGVEQVGADVLLDYRVT